MKSPSQRTQQAVSTWIAGALLVLVLGVRVYCAYFTVPIVTFDDRKYRQLAIEDGASLHLNDVPAELIAPQRDNLRGVRSRGYHSWLISAYAVTHARVLGSFDAGDPDRLWQTVNLLSLIVQLSVLFAFASWALNRSFALTTVVLYVTAPIVFGINRWVLTENHALTACLVFACSATWYLVSSRDAEFTRGRCACLVAIALAFGVLSSAREYCAPLMFGCIAMLCTGLSQQRRWNEVIIFLAILVPYLAGLLAWLPASLRHLAKNNAELRFMHPLSSWLGHALLHAVGVPLAAVLGLLVVLSLRALRKERIQSQSTLTWRDSLARRPIDLALLTLGGLFTAYALGVVQTQHRTMRPTLMLIVLGLCVAILLVRRTGLVASSLWPKIRALTTVAAVAAFGVWGFQLFVAFDAGRSYYHPATGMEIYNHPAHLPDLPPGQMHMR